MVSETRIVNIIKHSNKNEVQYRGHRSCIERELSVPIFNEQDYKRSRFDIPFT